MTTEQIVWEEVFQRCATAECLKGEEWKCGRGQHWVCKEHMAPMDKWGYGDNRCARCRQEDRS